MLKKLLIIAGFLVSFGLSLFMGTMIFRSVNIPKNPLEISFLDKKSNTPPPSSPDGQPDAVVYDQGVARPLNQFASFAQIKGRWTKQRDILFTKESVEYQNMDQQIQMRWESPSLQYRERGDSLEIKGMNIPAVHISMPLPFTDYSNVSVNDSIKINGAIHMDVVLVKLTHPLNQAHTLMEFSFKPEDIVLNGESSDVFLQILLKQVYNAAITQLRTADPDMMKKWVENALTFSLGWPVYIEKAEGSIDGGKLIFEDIYVNSKDTPILYIPQAIATVDILPMNEKSNQITISELSLFEPSISEAFSEERTAQTGEVWGNLNFIQMRLLQLIDEKPMTDFPYQITTSYDEVKVDDGTIKVIRLKQNDYSVYQGKIFGVTWLGGPHRLNYPDVPETYGLINSLVENFSKTARLLYDQSSENIEN